ncbi:glycosyltransferase [Pedococcus sp. KACC 23699]|uniref:4,4'-diaponeurosporenoate glycosyltransferase n=1 Tax=Pedococcus sp. KACC 23699 TaxID=3149228 RepID=A0AAU7JTK9_9MICO
MSSLRCVAVVVPARDEEQTLGGCLRSLDLARRALQRRRPEIAVRVLVVLDRCVDGSADVVAGHPDVETLVVSAGCVGGARAAGVDHALGRGHAGTNPRGRLHGEVVDLGAVWVASTDADSVVPPHWLTAQVDLAEGGHDLVLGTVEPHDLDASLLGRWAQRHHLLDGHPHVHGANLGVRASRYVEAGGFPGVGLHEDVLLADAVKATGAPWVATDSTRVRTAGRLEGRVDGGFATYLRELATDAQVAPAVP